MPNFASIIKVSGAIATGVAAVVAFIVMSLIQSGAAAGSPEQVERAVTTISAVVEAPEVKVTISPNVELICSLAHIGAEQAAECDKAMAEGRR